MQGKSTAKWINAWSFFAATYAVAWLIWLPAVVARSEQPNLALIAVGAFVPSTLGILFTYLTQEREGRRDFWRRVFDVRRIGWRWGAVIALLFPLTYALSGLAFSLLGGDLPPLQEILKQLLNPGLVAQLIVANLVISAFSEELGWRGFALDRLQLRWTALRASLVLGLAHALWHTPLFLIPGLSQGEMGLFSAGHLLFLLSVPLGAVLMTWVYNNTQRSILSAILLHFFQNFSLNLVSGLHGALPAGYLALLAAVLCLVAFVLVKCWGGARLTGRHCSAAWRRLSVVQRIVR